MDYYSADKMKGRDDAFMENLRIFAIDNTVHSLNDSRPKSG